MKLASRLGWFVVLSVVAVVVAGPSALSGQESTARILPGVRYRVRVFSLGSQHVLADTALTVDGKEARTDPAGEIVLDRPPGAKVTLVAERHVPVEFRLPLRAPATEGTLDLHVPRAAALVGRVNEPHGPPIPGASVTAFARTSKVRTGSSLTGWFERRRTTVTDDQGRYEIRGLPADVELQVSAVPPDRPRIEGSRPVVLEPGECRFVLLAPPSGGSIEGCVVTKEGRPVPGADVIRRGHGRKVLWRVTTDSRGRFRLPDVPRDGDETFLVVATSRSRGAGLDFPATRFTAEIGADGSVVRVQVTVLCNRFVEGRVVGPDGEPVGHITVWTREDGVVRTRTRADGRFRLGPLRPGCHRITAHAFPEQFCEMTQRGSPGVDVDDDTRDVVIRVPRTGILECRIERAASLPPAEVHVMAHLLLPGGGSTMVCPLGEQERDGLVRVTGLPPGMYHFAVCDRHRTCGAIQHDVKISEGGTVRGVTFRVAPAGQLRLTFGESWRTCKSVQYAVKRKDDMVTQVEEIDPRAPGIVHVLPGRVRLLFFGLDRPGGSVMATVETPLEVKSGISMDVVVEKPKTFQGAK